jgi:hypothetical protein
VAALAAVAQLILFRAEAVIDPSGGMVAGFIPRRTDFEGVWGAAAALVHGQPAHPWYGDAINVYYAPPFTVLLAPLGLLPRGVALPLGHALAGVLVAAALLGWARSGGAVTGGAIALILSIPVLSLVTVGQLEAAVGLAALSLAIWAQRRDRWLLVGVCAAIGVSRTANALPVLAMLAVGGWGRWRQLLTAAGAGALVLGALAGVAFWWDATWVGDYAHNLTTYPAHGLPQLAAAAAGPAGIAAVALAGCVAGALLAWSSRGRPLDVDRVAVGLALSVLIAPLQALYCAVFLLPAVLRLSLRRGFAGLPWVFAIVPWVVVLALAGALLSPRPAGTRDLLTLMAVPMLLALYPLLGPARGGRIKSEPVPR